MLIFCPHVCLVTEKGAVPNILFCHYYKGGKTQLIRFCREVLVDLFNVSDILDHEHLNRKLHSYGFGKEYIKLLFRYLLICWQRTKINAQFSS